MRKIIDALIELALLPMTALSGSYLKVIGKSRMRGGYGRTRLNRRLLQRIGVYPIVDHFYDPLIRYERLRHSLRDDRDLPGIDLNVEGQLQLLDGLNCQMELLEFPMNGTPESSEYYYLNDWFEVGDAEAYYSIIRTFKPRRIVEIGAGYSTLIAAAGIKRNQTDDPEYTCFHQCVEPYSNPWLEKTGAHVIREPVELVKKEIFTELENNDILFIDSSHIIRPQGDVLCEYLEILPIIKPGVLVHVHDIFTPKDYLDELLCDQGLFWNEQYLLEAYLSGNADYEIIAALNFLKYHHWDELTAKFPNLAKHHNAEPMSFWLRRKKSLQDVD